MTWNGELVPADEGDIVLRTSEKEHLRLKKDGTFLLNGAPGENNDQIVEALKNWLTGSQSGLPDAVKGRVLTVTAPKPPAQPPVTRAKVAHEALKTALREREATKAKAVASVEELLITFHTIIKPLVTEIGATMKGVANERLSNMFDIGGLINTISIDGIFGLELETASYMTYFTGTRKLTSPRELAVYLIDHHPGLDLDAALGRVGMEVEAISERVTKALATMHKIGANAAAVSLRLKHEEGRLLTDCSGPKGLLPG